MSHITQHLCSINTKHTPHTPFSNKHHNYSPTSPSAPSLSPAPQSTCHAAPESRSRTAAAAPPPVAAASSTPASPLSLSPTVTRCTLSGRTAATSGIISIATRCNSLASRPLEEPCRCVIGTTMKLPHHPHGRHRPPTDDHSPALKLPSVPTWRFLAAILAPCGKDSPSDGAFRGSFPPSWASPGTSCVIMEHYSHWMIVFPSMSLSRAFDVTNVFPKSAPFSSFWFSFFLANSWRRIIKRSTMRFITPDAPRFACSSIAAAFTNGCCI